MLTYGHLHSLLRETKLVEARGREDYQERKPILRMSFDVGCFTPMFCMIRSKLTYSPKVPAMTLFVTSSSVDMGKAALSTIISSLQALCSWNGINLSELEVVLFLHHS
jgi:hypothetical protein